MSNHTTTYHCLCLGSVHDTDCWTRHPAAPVVTDIRLHTHALCSCGYRGMHSLPNHLWRYWFPNVSWLRSTWGNS